MTNIQELQSQYGKSVKELELAATRSTNVCLVAKYIALQDALLFFLLEGYGETNEQ